jgi:hypothetical protein
VSCKDVSVGPKEVTTGFDLNQFLEWAKTSRVLQCIDVSVDPKEVTMQSCMCVVTEIVVEQGWLC